MLKQIKTKCSMIITLLTVFCCMLPAVEAVAGNTATVTQSSTDEREVYLFVDGIHKEPDRIEGYIGSEIATEIEWKRMEESDTSIKTLVLMDTSLSIKSEVKEHFKTMLKTMVENKLPNESIAIATYGKTPKYLCDYQTDVQVLIQAVDSISYKKQSSYLYQSIYDIVTDFNELNDNCLKRIIVFSDGDDTNSEGVSKTEVLTLLDKTKYPVYTVGCPKDTNAEGLKDFFALSRITGAKSLSFSMDTTMEEMKEFVCAIGDYLEIKIKPSENMMDGGIKNIALTVFGATETYDVTADVRVGRVVPVEPEEEEEQQEAPTAEAEQQEAVVTKPIVTKAPEKEDVSETPKSEEKGGSLIKVLAVIVLVLAVAGLAIYYVLKKSNEKKPASVPANMPVMQPALENMSPVPVAAGREYAQEEVYQGLTVILEDAVRKQRIPVRLYEYAEGRFVSIGRNREKCDVTIDYDNSISQVHCVLYTTDYGVCVEDCQSTNHTYLNGNPVVETECVSEGDILTLGKAKFLVHIVQK